MATPTSSSMDVPRNNLERVHTYDTSASAHFISMCNTRKAPNNEPHKRSPAVMKPLPGMQE